MGINKYMRAVTFDGAGGPEVIKVTKRPIPSLQTGEVLIKVSAAGINRPDILQRQGLYAPPIGATDIPGLEVAGEIVDVANSKSFWNIGDHVCAIVPGGGYAEYVAVHETNIAPLPNHLSFSEGSAIMETFLTVWSHLFNFAQFCSGKSILIHGGASGIGTTATMLAKAFGASQIFTTVSKKSDQSSSLAIGADIAINYKKEDFVDVVKEQTNGHGVDFILDIIGGDYVQRNYSAAALYGTILQVGVMHGPASSLDLFPMLAKRLTHKGITLRSQSTEEKSLLIRDLIKHVWPLIESGTIKPILDREFKLEEARVAHIYMEQSQHFGKVVLRVG